MYNISIMKHRIRAVAIIIKNEEVLLMFRRNRKKEFYVFPGGGVEDNESIEEGVLREVKEETCLEVKIEKLLCHHHYIKDSDQYFYLCSYISGEPMLGEANEKERMRKSKHQFYQPLWVPLNKLKDMLLYPLEIRDWLLTDVQNNFQNTPRKASMETRMLRQRL